MGCLHIECDIDRGIDCICNKLSDTMPVDENAQCSTYTGRCLCKGVGFTVKGNPNAVFCCYCGDCALGAGGPCQIVRLNSFSSFSRKFSASHGIY